MILPCLILGDSIAGGTGEALRAALGSRCEVVSRVGASTLWATAATPADEFRTAVLATGSNDAQALDLPQRLAMLRAGVAAQRVVWILPYDRRAAGMIRQVAMAKGDRWIDLGTVPAADDGVHPRSYVPVAEAADEAIAAAERKPSSLSSATTGKPLKMDSATGVWGVTAPIPIF